MGILSLPFKASLHGFIPLSLLVCESRVFYDISVYVYAEDLLLFFEVLLTPSVNTRNQPNNDQLGGPGAKD